MLCRYLDLEQRNPEHSAGAVGINKTSWQTENDMGKCDRVRFGREANDERRRERPRTIEKNDVVLKKRIGERENLCFIFHTIDYPFPVAE